MEEQFLTEKLNKYHKTLESTPIDLDRLRYIWINLEQNQIDLNRFFASPYFQILRSSRAKEKQFHAISRKNFKKS